jgi:large-conductance mechanosensitive channel
LHDRSADFGWGAFVYSLVTFLLIVASIYAIIKLFKLDKLDAPKNAKPKEKKKK